MRRGTLKAGSALIATGLLVAGCGSSSSKQPPTAELSRASYVSSAATGYKVAMNVRESVPGAGQVTVSGTGTFNVVPKREGKFNMQLNIPAAASAGLANLQMQAVFVPNTIYVKLPPSLASRVPGGKPWLEISLSQLGKAAGVPGLGSLANSSASLSNPGQYLDYLRATSDGSVKDLGTATLDGVKTTHYHAVVDLNKLPNVVPASSRPAVQQLVATLRSRGTATQLPLDAWIDSSHRVRRIAMAYAQPINGQQASVALQADFLGYGPQAAPTVPPASQTQNLLALTGGKP